MDETDTTFRWRTGDLLDLDHFLRLDQEADAEVVSERDEAWAKAYLAESSESTALQGGDSSHRREMIGAWLRRRRQGVDRDELAPSQALKGSRQLLSTLLGLAGLMAGIGLVAALLNREWRYFNVPLFLAVTLLPQFALLLVMGGAWVLRSATGRSAGFGVAVRWVQRLLAALGERAFLRNREKEAREFWSEVKRRPYLGWVAARLAQWPALGFNAGLVIGLLGSLAFLDVRFFWESTPAVAAAPTLHAITRCLGWPWSWARPDAVPTLEEVSATRVEITGGEQGFQEVVDSAAAWAPFLLLTLLTWGLLPRLGLWMAFAFGERRAVDRYGFGERAHRELWRRMTQVRVDAPSLGAGDEALVILWGGFDPDRDTLREVLLRQLRCHPAQVVEAGGLELGGDREALDKTLEGYREADGRAHVVLVAESWGLVPRDLEPFLRRLRDALGPEPAACAFLVGAPKGEAVFTEPEADEIENWDRFFAELDDPALRLQPLRDLSA